MNTADWYLNSPANGQIAHVFTSGIDHDTEAFTSYFLAYAPEYQNAFALSTLLDPDYPIPQATPIDSTTCNRFINDARAAAQSNQQVLLN